MVRRGVFPSLKIPLLWCISGGATGRAMARRCVLGHRSPIFLGCVPLRGVGMRANCKQLLHVGSPEVGSAMGLLPSCSKFPVEV